MTNLFFITKANKTDFQKSRMMDTADTKNQFFSPFLDIFAKLQFIADFLHLHF